MPHPGDNIHILSLKTKRRSELLVKFEEGHAATRGIRPKEERDKAERALEKNV